MTAHYFASSILRRSSMQQFLPCNSCGNQVPVPELSHGDVEPEFLDCEKCGQQIAWRLETIVLETPDEPEEFVLELDPESESSELENSELESSELENSELEGAEVEGSKAALSMSETPQLESSESKSPEPVLDWSVLGPAIPRRRQKEVSAIRKIVPPVLGGLAAFPIATLIMWYGFGKDIGSTGPTVS